MKKKNKILPRSAAPYLMVLPMLAIVCIFMLYPIFNTFWLSMQNHVLTNIKEMGFNRGAGFIRLFHDEIFRRAAVNSLVWTFMNVGLQLVFGLLTALLLNQEFKGRGIFRALIFMPWAVGGILVALIWSFMFNENVGVIGDLLIKIGIGSGRISWFSKGSLAMWAMVIANTWRGIPFFAICILSALQTLPSEIYESARVDGASVFYQFKKITLPLIKDALLLTTLLRTIWTLNVVDIIYGMTKGGPNFSTLTIPVYIMMTFNDSLDAGYASAMAVVIIMILLIFSALFLKAGKYGREANY